MDIATLVGLVLAFGLHVNQVRPAGAPPAQGMLEGYALSKRIPFMLAELAPQNQLDRGTVGECERGLFNVMRQLGMLSGELALPAEQMLTQMGCTETLLKSEREGLCEPLVDNGETVREGQVLARLWSLDSFDVLEEFVAPHDGLVINILRFSWGEDNPPSAVVHPGSAIVLVRELGESIRNPSDAEA